MVVDEKILRLRKELNDSIVNGKDYDIIYKLSIELDELIMEYYKRRMALETNQSLLLK